MVAFQGFASRYFFRAIIANACYSMRLVAMLGDEYNARTRTRTLQACMDVWGQPCSRGVGTGGGGW